LPLLLQFDAALSCGAVNIFTRVIAWVTRSYRRVQHRISFGRVAKRDDCINTLHIHFLASKFQLPSNKLASCCEVCGRSRWGRFQMMAKKSPNPTDKYVGSRVRMRRLMLSMSQEKLGEKLGLTFQQVQKYEKGTNRIGASRLQHIAQILKVPVSFFFEGVSGGKQSEDGSSKAPVADYVSDFLSSSDGLALTKAFTNIKDSKLRRRVVDLVEEIAGDQR